MTAVRRIALLMGQDIGYTRDVMRGVQAYGHSRPGWVFRDAPPDLRILGPLRADYDFWKSRFGATSGSGSVASSAAVPEPTTLAFALIGLVGAVLTYRRS